MSAFACQRWFLKSLGVLWLLLAFALVGPVKAAEHAESAKAAQAVLPHDVFIKTPTQTFNSRFYYALYQGRIWIKANRQVSGKDEPWQLMPCNGLPCQPDHDDFPIPEAIAEISADGDELTTIDDKGRFYIRTMAGPGWFSATEWTAQNGVPKGTLMLPERLQHKRAWSMGRRHFDVLWSEDADGNPHHVGTMGTSTIYVLGENGSEIWYTDNGLPADLSHIACGPERGGFVAENLQASAGTLFVSNGAGEMFTSLDDFDLNGGTSMFISYTYTPQKPYTQPKGSDYVSHLTPWRLPIEQWQRQPAIPLTGQARLSKDITILQNGQGNAARELRVAGLDSAGRTGYYFKPILASAWSFQLAELRIAADRWQTPGKLAPARLLPQDITYEGALQLGPDEVYMAEVTDFNMNCSPAHMKLFLADGPVDLLLHTVDAWIDVKRQDPGRDGSIQLMLGTLEASPESLAKLPPMLKNLDRNVFQLHVGATTDQLYLFYLDGRVQGVLPRIKPLPVSVKSINYRYILPPGSYASARLREAHLELLRTLDPSQIGLDIDRMAIGELQAEYAQTLKLAKQLQAESELLMEAKQQAWLEAMFATTLRGAYTVTGMCWWVPNGTAVCRTAQNLLAAHYRLEDDLNQQALERYRLMQKQVSARLLRYTERLEELGRSPAPVSLVLPDIL